MSGSISEFGVCEVCGKKRLLRRKYYHYNIKCECCSPEHFELVRYCSHCKPSPPTSVEVTLEINPGDVVPTAHESHASDAKLAAEFLVEKNILEHKLELAEQKVRVLESVIRCTLGVKRGITVSIKEEDRREDNEK